MVINVNEILTARQCSQNYWFLLAVGGFNNLSSLLWESGVCSMLVVMEKIHGSSATLKQLTSCELPNSSVAVKLKTKTTHI